jgi:hypothetical protein
MVQLHDLHWLLKCVGEIRNTSRILVEHFEEVECLGFAGSLKLGRKIVPQDRKKINVLLQTR